MMLLCAVMALVFGIAGGRFASRASSGFASNLRDAMYVSIQNYSFSNIDKYSTAGLITRLTTDVTNVQNAYQMMIRMMMRSPAMLILALCMTISISPRLSLIFLGAAAFLGCALTFILKHATSAFSRVFVKYDDLNSSVQENVTGIRVGDRPVQCSHRGDLPAVRTGGELYRLQLSCDDADCVHLHYCNILERRP